MSNDLSETASESVTVFFKGKSAREEYLVMSWKTSARSFQTYASSHFVSAGLFLSVDSICCLAPVLLPHRKVVPLPSRCFQDVSRLWVIETAVVLCLKGN